MRGSRLLAAVLGALLLVGTAVAASSLRTGEGPIWDLFARADLRNGPATDADPRAPDEVTDGELPTSVDDAEALGGDALLALGLETAAGPWTALGGPSWDAVERPVYVVEARLDDRREVRADVVIAFRADSDMDELVLRALPAARALERGDLQVTVRRDGGPAAHEVDRDGARLLVSLDPPLSAGEAAVVRVGVRYSLVGHNDIDADSGPAGFGLLAWTEAASVLGHWVPLLTVDEGPMLPHVDVSAFPAAIWSVTVETDAELATGGEASDCPDGRDACFWVRGIALREVALVAYDDTASTSTDTAGVALRTIAPTELEARVEAAHRAAVRSFESLAGHLGPLAWRTLDVAWVPLRGTAAGMEFPGLILMDLDMAQTLAGGFGEFVVAHEVAHQWFEALVGSGSLTAPVVDESLAQYLAYVYWVDEYGQEAADTLADTLMREPYLRALAEGMEDAPPARPAEEFTDDRELFILVYCRGALAWIAAERELGRGTVLAYLAGVVERHSLRFLGVEEFLDDAREHEPRIADVLERWWFEPDTPPDARDAPRPPARERA